MFIPELLEPDDPFARTRADLEEYLATGKCATETHGCDNSQTAPTTKRCEICGTKEATETYDIDMYYIEKKEYVPPFGKKFKYRTQKVKVPCCASCIKSIGRGNVVVSIVVLLSATLAYLFLFSHVASSVLQHIVAFVFVCCITGFLGLPIFWLISMLCGESRLCRKSSTVKKLKEQGWQIGTKPSKCDM